MNNQQIVKFTLDLYNKLQSEREELENIWGEVCKYVRPNLALTKEKAADVYDSTAMLAAEYLTSSLWSYISNSSTNWFYLKAKDSAKENPLIKAYLHTATEAIKDSFHNSQTGFYYKCYEFYADLVNYGTAIFYTYEDLTRKEVSYQTCNLQDTYIYSASNTVDTVIRKIVLSATEALDFFGENNVSKKILRSSKEQNNEEFTFLHITCPAKIMAKKFHSSRKMPFASYYIDVAEQSILQESGYFEFPFMVSRWYTHTNNLYGQSPAMIALPDIKMVNAMAKTMLIAAQKLIDPPMLAPNELSIQGIKTVPGSVIYGGIDPLTGNQLIKPLAMGIESGNTYTMQEQVRNSVRESFFYSLLLYAYSANATATEVLSVNEQKLKILGSKIARIQSEFLYPLIKRQLVLLQRLGLVQGLPISFHWQDIEVVFLSSWNRFEKFTDSFALSQTSNFIQSVQSFCPDAYKLVDWQAAISLMAEANGLSKNIMNNNITTNNLTKGEK